VKNKKLNDSTPIFNIISEKKEARGGTPTAETVAKNTTIDLIGWELLDPFNNKILRVL
jgi:hypothetical protein